MFDNATERANAIRKTVPVTARNRPSVPQVFRYGIQFRSDRLISHGSAATQGHRRAVQFFFLEPGCTIRDVLSRVRGGVIVSATRAALHTTVRIVFLREEEAARYVAFAEGAPALIQELGSNTLVTHLDSETYPDSPAVSTATAQGWSRCISIRGFTPGWKDSDRTKRAMSNIWHLHLLRVWRRAQDRLEDAWVPPAGNLFLCFTSIAASVEFRNAELSHPERDRLQIRMEIDPCARSPAVSDGDIGEPARGQSESILDTFWLIQPRAEIQADEPSGTSPRPRSSSSSSPPGVFGKPDL